MKSWLKVAAYAGILSLVVIAPEIFLEEMFRQHPETHWLALLVVAIYVVSVGTTVLFYYGFCLLGHRFGAPAITMSSWVIILLNLIWYVFQVVALWQTFSFYNVFGGTVLVVFGASRLAFGYGVFRVRAALGRFATSIALLEVVIGLFLISVSLYLVGFVLSLVVAVLQIMLLLGLSRSLGAREAVSGVAGEHR
jgi:hypothetical protein